MFLLRLLHKFYKKCISPFLGDNCRFYPFCSDYAMQAFEEHGYIKGTYLTAKRLGRCHPWTEGGYDPVPSGSKTDQHECCAFKQQTQISKNLSNGTHYGR